MQVIIIPELCILKYVTYVPGYVLGILIPSVSGLNQVFKQY